MMKPIVSIKDFAKAIKKELSRHKKLSCETLTSPWIVPDAPEGYNAVHKEDPVTHLKRVGRETAQKLATARITKFKHIKILTIEK